MIPRFDPNKWDKEKILDYVIGEQPLTDEQLEFLNYFDKLQEEHYVLTEFEKCLEEEIDKRKNANILDHHQVETYYIILALLSSLEKLHKLKGENK